MLSLKKKIKTWLSSLLFLVMAYTSEDNFINDINDDILCKCGCE